MDTSHLVVGFMEAFGLTSKDSDTEQVKQMIGDHLEAVMYNVASVAVIFTLLKGNGKIQPKHIADVTTYISATCSKKHGQKGGTSMASDYFGYLNPSYQAANAGQGVVMSEVQFDQGVARAGIDSQLGGGSGPHLRLVASHSNDAKRFIKGVMRLHNMHISKSAFVSLLHVIDIHMNCLGHDLIATHNPISPAKITKVVSLKRHSVFH